MNGRRWLDRTQPQTLQIAVMLLYLHAAFDLLAVLLGTYFGIFGLALIAGEVGAGYGIANEKKWGYGLGLVMAFLPFILALIFLHTLFVGGIVTLMFEIAFIALLLHPQSREYQRIWFK